MSQGYQCVRKAVSELTEFEKQQMFALLDAHFHNVRWANFSSDLFSKDIAFLLRDQNSAKLLGFSTQKILNLENGVTIVFSGDTIIDPSAWGSLAFPRAWGLWMLGLYQAEPSRPLYWLLISKGHRTYRYLPTFFLDFSPSFKRSYSDVERSLIMEVGTRLFPGGLDTNDLGFIVVNSNSQSQFLRQHLISEQDQLSQDAYIKFFLHANPAYRSGTELVCLLKFEPNNMRPFCKRLLRLDARDSQEAIVNL